MIDINILKCELVRLAAIYAGKLIWGFDCELEELKCRVYTLYNYIELLTATSSAGNTCKCTIPSTLYHDILVCQQQISSNPIASFCNNC